MSWWWWPNFREQCRWTDCIFLHSKGSSQGSEWRVFCLYNFHHATTRSMDQWPWASRAIRNHRNDSSWWKMHKHLNALVAWLVSIGVLSFVPGWWLRRASRLTKWRHHLVLPQSKGTWAVLPTPPIREQSLWPYFVTASWSAWTYKRWKMTYFSPSRLTRTVGVVGPVKKILFGITLDVTHHTVLSLFPPRLFSLSDSYFQKPCRLLLLLIFLFTILSLVGVVPKSPLDDEIMTHSTTKMCQVMPWYGVMPWFGGECVWQWLF